MSVLITGGYGQLGSWLARQFASQGKEVIALDTIDKDLDYLKEVKSKITFVRADVLNFSRLVEIFIQYKGKIEGVIHTVAITADPSFYGNPYHGLDLNMRGTINIQYPSYVEHHAYINGVKAAVEVYLVVAKTGQLPETLPEGLPKDPSSGQDFVYEITDDGFALRCQNEKFLSRTSRRLEFKVKKEKLKEGY